MSRVNLLVILFVSFSSISSFSYAESQYQFELSGLLSRHALDPLQAEGKTHGFAASVYFDAVKLDGSAPHSVAAKYQRVARASIYRLD